MKRLLSRIVLPILLLIAIGVVLNMRVTTRQGIDYEVRQINIPLYLKALDFIDRYYNYGALADRITEGKSSDTEKVIAILKWTRENIRENPKSLPVVDDHAWNIIIRGYGRDDQFQDVFTTLCNREGIGAFFSKIVLPDKSRAKSFSFVLFEGDWSVFDAYHGIYFVNSRGKPAILDDIQNGDWKAVKVCAGSGEEDYGAFFDRTGSIDFHSWKDSRAAIQSPLRRLIYWLKGNKQHSEGNLDHAQK